MTYDDWLTTLSSNPDVMGGAVTFPNTKVTVHRVGSLLLKGESFDTLLEDYPTLSALEIKFAARYVYEQQHFQQAS